MTDVIALKFSEPAIGPGGRAIDIRLIGTDLDEIKAAALELKTWFSDFDGVIDLADDLRPGKREYRLHLKDGAGVIGLDANNVADQVRAAFQGFKTDEFPLGPETYEVELRMASGDRNDIADLEQHDHRRPGKQADTAAGGRRGGGGAWLGADQSHRRSPYRHHPG